MTTATTTNPLESYQQGRDKFMAVVLDAMSGLESTVLGYEHQHEHHARAAGTELSLALAENNRLHKEVGDQALELDASRSHVCPVPEFTPVPGVDPLDTSAVATISAAEDSSQSDESARIIAELRAGLEAEQRTSAALRVELEAERRTSAELRGDVAERNGKISALKEAAEAQPVAAEADRETEENFNRRLAEGVRSAEAGTRSEAIRIIEAIAADNPALEEAADLFTVAFAAPGDAAGTPKARPEKPAAQETAGLPGPGEDFFNALPAPEPEAAPAPLTQAYMPAPDLDDDAIVNPHFFDNPQTLEEPAPDASPVEAPKPGHGIFGRKKENQSA